MIRDRNLRRPWRSELIRLRQTLIRDGRFRTAAEFADRLGITRLHLTSVERGRKDPSPELAVAWIELIGKPASLEMFGPLPLLDERIRTAKRIKRLEPDTYEAA